MYLGTGSGKTFIAIMLIKEMREQIKNKKKAIFLVNSVALVDQQAEAIRICTGLSVSYIHCKQDMHRADRYCKQDIHQLEFRYCSQHIRKAEFAIIMHYLQVVVKCKHLKFDNCLGCTST